MANHTDDKDQQQHETEEGTLLTVAEPEKTDQTKLRRQVWGYYLSGDDKQTGIRRNREAYGRYFAYRRHLCHAFWQEVCVTGLVSPGAMQKLVGGEGELDVARAVVDRGTL